MKYTIVWWPVSEPEMRVDLVEGSLDDFIGLMRQAEERMNKENSYKGNAEFKIDEHLGMSRIHEIFEGHHRNLA